MNFKFISENRVEFDNYLEQEVHNYNKRIQYNKEIIDFTLEAKHIKNIEYNLIAVICTPQYDHYTGIIYNYRDIINSLEKRKYYYYDDTSDFPNIIEISDLLEYLIKNNPYIALFKNITNIHK